MSVSESVLQQISSPAAGTVLDRARAFGMDLTIIARNAALSPEKRLDKAVQSQVLMHTIREIRKDSGR